MIDRLRLRLRRWLRLEVVVVAPDGAPVGPPPPPKKRWTRVRAWFNFTTEDVKAVRHDVIKAVLTALLVAVVMALFRVYLPIPGII
jgi:hypothetical protein